MQETNQTVWARTIKRGTNTLNGRRMTSIYQSPVKEKVSYFFLLSVFCNFGVGFAILYTGKILPPFYFRPFRPLT